MVICDDLWHPAEVIEKGLAARADGRFSFDIVKAAKDILTPARIAKYRLIVCCKSNSVIAVNPAPWFEPGVTEVGPAEFEEFLAEREAHAAVRAGDPYSFPLHLPHRSFMHHSAAFVNSRWNRSSSHTSSVWPGVSAQRRPLPISRV